MDTNGGYQVSEWVCGYVECMHVWVCIAPLELHMHVSMCLHVCTCMWDLLFGLHV